MKRTYKIKAKGDSIWTDTRGGQVLVNDFKITYIDHQDAIPVMVQSNRYRKWTKAGFTSHQFVSMDVTGPTPLPFWYTDSGAEEQVLEVFKEKLKKQFKCHNVELSWSEQGMQGKDYWNFDVNLLWK